jgi:hypothetical protein
MSDVVKVWDDGPVRIVQINRPEKGNAISADVAVGIQNAMLDFDADDALRCAVITGAAPCPPYLVEFLKVRIFEVDVDVDVHIVDIDVDVFCCVTKRGGKNEEDKIKYM